MGIGMPEDEHLFKLQHVSRTSNGLIRPQLEDSKQPCDTHLNANPHGYTA
jgi:hypothetical protein